MRCTELLRLLGLTALSVACGENQGGGAAAASGSGGGAGGSSNGGATSGSGGAIPGGGGRPAANGGAANGGGGSPAGGTSSSGGAPSAGGSSAGLPVDECATPEPDWIFCSGFEEGNKSIWDDYDGNPDSTNLLMENAGPFGNAGNHVMRLRAAPGRGGADLVKLLPASNAKLYARWYIQYEPGFDFTAANHGGGLHAGARDWLGHSDTRPAGDEWYTGWVEYDPSLGGRPYVYSYYPGMYMDCADPNGACWGDHFPCMLDEGTNYCTKPEHREVTMPAPYETGRWYCVELLLDGGTPTPSASGASGAIDLFIDGQEMGPWNDLWMRSTPDLQVNILWLNLFHHAEHSVEGVFYDHVVVSTSRVGCSG